jgi:hypothetical protein
VTESKANDPKRRALVELFDLWYAKHKNTPIKAAQLDPEIIQRIDAKAHWENGGNFRYNRQWVAGFLNGRTGTRVGGYTLIQIKKGKASRQVAAYSLVKETATKAAEEAEFLAAFAALEAGNGSGETAGGLS